ncbi:MAG TPA: tetratricopeptide repeat protein, partial [Ktedonobacteraceae bacterium]|nr:tetratricopeptide repeat protein [Ktedonobacteraceae bacterium]
EFAPEEGEQKLGLFTYRLIVGLCGPASDPTTGTIMLRPLHTYLFKNLGEQQRPQLFGQDQPPLVLVGTAPQPLQQISPTDAPPPGAGMLNQQNIPTGSQPIMQAMQAPTATAQKTATGQLPHPSMEQHRRQQCKLRLEQAQHLLQTQNYGEAFNIVEQILQILPNDPTTLIFKGQLLGKAGLYPEALAVVDQLTKIDPNNPLVWSMRAFLLASTGQHRPALEAIEHSLELDATNPESYAIKNNIMANIATTQSKRGATSPLQKQQKSSTVLLMGMLWQFAGFIIGTAGSLLPVFLPSLPGLVGVAFISLGLAWLSINAARGTYRYGFLLFLPTLVISLISAGLLGALYVLAYKKIIQMIIAHPAILVPILFLILWLASAAILPFMIGLGGTISRAVRSRRQ